MGEATRGSPGRAELTLPDQSRRFPESKGSR
jgi:hypothetical protein